MPNEKEDSGTRLIFNTLIEYQKEVDRLNEIIVLLKKDNELLSNNSPMIMGIPSGQYHLFGKTQSRFPTLMQQPFMFNPEMDEHTIIERISKIHNVRPYNSEILTGLKPMRPIEELLLMQSKGQKLTKEEKDRCIAHAEMIRKKRKK